MFIICKQFPSFFYYYFYYFSLQAGDEKKIKSALKSAREAIRLKEFKDALKHCKVRIDIITWLKFSHQELYVTRSFVLV